jgi:hypothetical protein
VLTAHGSFYLGNPGTLGNRKCEDQMARKIRSVNLQRRRRSATQVHWCSCCRSDRWTPSRNIEAAVNGLVISEAASVEFIEKWIGGYSSWCHSPIPRHTLRLSLSLSNAPLPSPTSRRNSNYNSKRGSGKLITGSRCSCCKYCTVYLVLGDRSYLPSFLLGV